MSRWDSVPQVQSFTWFIQACGSKTRKYLESITTDYGPLKTLTASGLFDFVYSLTHIILSRPAEASSKEVQVFGLL